MSTVVCKRNCKYNKGGVFCGKDFVILNNGLCDIWFDKRGMPRFKPNYDAEENQPPAEGDKK